MDTTRLKELRALVRNAIIDDAGAELARYVLDEFLPYARNNDYHQMDRMVLAKFKEPKQKSQVLTIAELIRRYQSTRDVDISALIKFVENYSSFVAQERKVPGNKPRGRLYEAAKKFRLVRNNVVHSSLASLKWTTELSIQEDIAGVGKLLEMIAPESEVVRRLRLLSRDVHEYFAESTPEAVPREDSPGEPAAEYAAEADTPEEEPEAEEGVDGAESDTEAEVADERGAGGDDPIPIEPPAPDLYGAAEPAGAVPAALPANAAARSFRRPIILGGGFFLLLFAALFLRGVFSWAPPAESVRDVPSQQVNDSRAALSSLAVVVLDVRTAREHGAAIEAYLGVLVGGRPALLTVCDVRTGMCMADTVQSPAQISALLGGGGIAGDRPASGWLRILQSALEASAPSASLVYIVPANASAGRLRSLPSAEVSTPEFRGAIAAKGVRVHVLCPDDPAGNEVATAMKTLFPTLTVHRL